MKKLAITAVFAAALLVPAAAMAHDDHDHNPPPTHNVPEPSSLVMLASGLAGLGAFGFRRRKKA